MEPNTTQTPTNTPVQEPQVPIDAPAPVEPGVETPPVTEEPASQVQTVEAPATTTQEAPVPPVEEEEEYQTYQPIPQVAPIDFSQLPVDENNLIDPNALAGMINQRIAQSEQNAVANAQRIYAEQEQEKNLWTKAYEKYPDLKTNKELRDMVHQSRLGKVTELLSSTNDPAQIKFPTPSQMADSLFKHISAQKAEGFKQATQNTEIQQSVVLEKSGKAGVSGDDTAQLQANLNNPNKEVRDKARNSLLRKKLGWE